ncbi:hypothetical protein HYH03_004124 [Edaphochlamys debaryana]|uniref:Nop domain-containing protein n=1 Tax=Edaphochlamys debaryana TaxID=47281 RepID=A0A835YAR9_9CHLO|nr:hypothetical protein HYH03_004124 [Edaphochlamys debaryana]|eukprot:KAG2497858.1 hypothetical protein HYH03_004124 [Edaphochlamys debaryana]
MATLAESFLADLEDLSDDEPEQESEEEEEEAGDGMDDIEALNFDDLTAVAKLTSEPRYSDVLGRVRAALEQASTSGPVDDKRTAGPLEEDPTYKLLVECNRLAVDIDNEIAVVHTFIRDKYRPKFPELESLVHHPLDYARVVQRIGNEMDLTLVPLDDMLPAATVMVVTVTATTTSGKPLDEEALQRVKDGCDMAILLDEDKRTILQFVESKMNKVAPNLSAVVGTEVAAKLMGVAGGLLALSRMPACNVQVLGAKRKTLAGFSSTTAQPHQGFIFGCSIMGTTPPSLRGKAARLIAAKSTLLARKDAYGEDPTGAYGSNMRAEVVRKIEKWQEPPPAKQIKPLPVPDAEAKKRRGGRRLRKMKERYGLTDVRKAANRMMFNQAEEEFVDGEDTIGLGVLGKEGSGRLRIVASQQKQKLSAKAQKKFKTKAYGSSGATSGLSSSLAFTPVQGIELENPNARLGQDLDTKDGTQSYFSAFGGFRSVKKL